jgi:hypothetical protein
VVDVSWLKKSDDFGRDCRDLSDAAYRLHDEGLLWVMYRENGGRFPKRELYWFAGTLDPDKAVAELLACGFWLDLVTDYEIKHHMEHQTEPEVMRKRRENDAKRQRARRRKAVGLPAED